MIGKQWMWHVQHPEGPREINELHVPVGVPTKLTMTSQDVIHDFYIPAFRVKKDVLPGRYTSLWFEPTQTGVFPPPSKPNSAPVMSFVSPAHADDTPPPHR